LKVTDTVALSTTQAKIYNNMALAIKYCLSVALALKMLDTPDFKDVKNIVLEKVH